MSKVILCRFALAISYRLTVASLVYLDTNLLNSNFAHSNRPFSETFPVKMVVLNPAAIQTKRLSTTLQMTKRKAAIKIIRRVIVNTIHQQNGRSYPMQKGK